MSLPSGWMRTACATRVEFEGLCDQTVYADSSGVWLIGHESHGGDYGDDALRTVQHRDALISILFRAFKQHAHLAAHPAGPPLPEDKEETEIVA